MFSYKQCIEYVFAVEMKGGHTHLMYFVAMRSVPVLILVCDVAKKLGSCKSGIFLFFSLFCKQFYTEIPTIFVLTFARRAVVVCIIPIRQNVSSVNILRMIFIRSWIFAC